MRSWIVLGVAALCGSCIGAGEGEVRGTVSVPLCGVMFPSMVPGQPVGAAYQRSLNFFAAERTGRALQFRAQFGSGNAEYTDHLYFRIDDADALRAQIAASGETDPVTGARQLTVPVGPQGAPGVLVHGYFVLRWSCGRQRASRLGINLSLPAVSGTMVLRSVDGGINDPERLTDVSSFRLVYDDPRPIGDPAPTGFLPTDRMGHAELSGNFRFRYSRALPAQGFPGT
ncbi:MAG: hypothetical protein Q8Q09_29435 [Deltaproteobacteria bacterium]|nr:hypothetical protein [Deltaproteobacteria bacterium]